MNTEGGRKKKKVEFEMYYFKFPETRLVVTLYDQSTELHTIQLHSWKQSENHCDTDTSDTRAHLSQPSSKLSQLFINMKLCLSHVEQCDFLLRRTGIVWPLSRATVTPLPISQLTHIVQESISLLIVWKALICPNPETICNTEEWDKL